MNGHIYLQNDFLFMYLTWLGCLRCKTYISDRLIGIYRHYSESRGQEEAGRMRRMSELFTRRTAVKFVDALNKPPLKLSLSYIGLSTF